MCVHELDWSGSVCVCVCKKKDWLAAGLGVRRSVQELAGERTRKEKREAYKQLHVSTTYGHVSYPPANPDA